MKLYTFLNEDGEILEQVRANNHKEALNMATAKEVATLEQQLEFGCDFYSDTIEA